MAHNGTPIKPRVRCEFSTRETIWFHP